MRRRWWWERDASPPSTRVWRASRYTAVCPGYSCGRSSRAGDCVPRGRLTPSPGLRPLGASPSPAGRRWREAPDEGKDPLVSIVREVLHGQRSQAEEREEAPDVGEGGDEDLLGDGRIEAEPLERERHEAAGHPGDHH